MIVSAWRSGGSNESGAGYGLRLSKKDRDEYFKKQWKTVFLHLPDSSQVEVNTMKKSFWEGSCQELMNKKIGEWLIKNGYVPWPKYRPPKFRLKSNKDRHFVLEILTP